MNKVKVFAIALLLSVSSQAQMLCDVVESTDSVQTAQRLSLETNGQQTHGAILYFKLGQFKQYSGMVAFLRGYAVISLNDMNTGLALSTQARLEGDNVAHQQVILPSANGSSQSITVDCQLFE